MDGKDRQGNLPLRALERELVAGNEVCDELGITRSKLNAAVTRICKTVANFTDKDLLALEDVKQGEREKRIAAIPVPEPNLPRDIRKALTVIGRELTIEQAEKAVAHIGHD